MTDTTCKPLTPAEHRALAELDLSKMRPLTPGTPARQSLALSAIAHTLAAVACYLDPDEVTEPEVRLPGGRVVRAVQAPEGARQWGFTVTGPDGTVSLSSEYRWGSADAALAAGTGTVIGAATRGPVRATRIARAAAEADGQNGETP